MSGVRFPLETTSKLTTFGLWKRIDSTPHPWGRSMKTRPTTLCALMVSVVIAGKHTMSYPSWLWKYDSLVILVLVSSMASNLTRWNA